MADLTSKVNFLTVPDLKAKDPLHNLSGLELDKYFKLPAQDVLDAIVKALEARGYKVHVVSNAAGAVEAVKSIIPSGASVMTPMSATVAQTGIQDLIQNHTEWKNLKAAINAENDEHKRHQLRRDAIYADYWVSGVNAITQEGEIVVVDGTGSRTGGFMAAKNIVAVSSTQKIVKSFEEALERINKFCVPLEGTRYNLLMGWPGAAVGSLYSVKAPAMYLGKGIHVILIKDELYGY